MQNTIHQRIIALVLLMVYAITGTSLLPALVSLAATLDGSHTVQVQQSEQGTTLTLLHHRADYTPRVDDHSNSLARFIVSMCKASEAGSHELSSSCISTGSRAERDANEREVKNAAQVNCQATRALVFSSRHPVRDTSRETRAWRDVPITPGLGATLSSVRLLI